MKPNLIILSIQWTKKTERQNSSRPIYLGASESSHEEFTCEKKHGENIHLLINFRTINWISMILPWKKLEIFCRQIEKKSIRDSKCLYRGMVAETCLAEIVARWRAVALIVEYRSIYDLICVGGVPDAFCSIPY